jgi:hypothetical protein
MAFMRSDVRTNNTEDLSARLRAAGRRSDTVRVLNLSEGGMLIAGGELEVGEVVSFEFAGPDFRSAGLAEVAHRTDEATGLRFTRWDTATERAIRKDRCVIRSGSERARHAAACCTNILRGSAGRRSKRVAMRDHGRPVAQRNARCGASGARVITIGSEPVRFRISHADDERRCGRDTARTVTEQKPPPGTNEFRAIREQLGDRRPLLPLFAQAALAEGGTLAGPGSGDHGIVG